MCVCVHVCTCLCVFTCVYMSLCVCAHVIMHAYECVYCLCGGVHVCMCIYDVFSSVYALRLQPPRHQRSTPPVSHEGSAAPVSSQRSRSRTSVSCRICLETVEQVCMMCVFDTMTSDCLFIVCVPV